MKNPEHTYSSTFHIPGIEGRFLRTPFLHPSHPTSERWKKRSRTPLSLPEKFCNRVFHDSSDNPFHPWSRFEAWKKDFVTVWLPVKRNISVSVHFPGQMLHSSQLLHLFLELSLISSLSLFYLIWNQNLRFDFKKFRRTNLVIFFQLSRQDLISLTPVKREIKSGVREVWLIDRNGRERPIRARGFFFLSAERMGERRDEKNSGKSNWRFTIPEKHGIDRKTRVRLKVKARNAGRPPLFKPIVFLPQWM